VRADEKTPVGAPESVEVRDRAPLNESKKRIARDAALHGTSMA
jgi:hypothetical protein